MPRSQTRKCKANKRVKAKKATRRRASLLKNLVRSVETQARKIGKTVGKVVRVPQHVAMNLLRKAEAAVAALTKKIRKVL